jgi:hypothetical protein
VPDPLTDEDLRDLEGAAHVWEDVYPHLGGTMAGVHRRVAEVRRLRAEAPANPGLREGDENPIIHFFEHATPEQLAMLDELAELDATAAEEETHG